ncbi:hypothetical protein F4780DRAFT_778172 [Xylariomycetidae sp. FL0641]|nr:hypothetical protein F4780DRAFT_778172 [Xylariomycetidae sp. FL0641]
MDYAVRDGDDIQGVLRATGNNQNRHNTSIADPTLESHSALYQHALKRAGARATDCQLPGPMREFSVTPETPTPGAMKGMQSLGLLSLCPGVLEGIRRGNDIVIRHATMSSVHTILGGIPWLDADIQWDAFFGNSLGDWAALTVSGALLLDHVVKLIPGRASIIQGLCRWGTGSVVTIEAD